MAQKGLPAGTRLTAAALDGAYAQGVIAQGNRTTAKTVTGSEAGVLRLDALALRAGNTYLFVAHGLRVTGGGTPANAHFACRIRYNGTGVAGTGDNEIGRCEWTENSALAYDSAPVVLGWVNPVADAPNGSCLLTVIQSSGAATTPSLNNDPGGIWLVVIDLGVVVANTGVII